ncbi:MAG: VPLPA-CTERM sorting domain-containing protein [Gammaproteobacteria bacterium]|nr:VPLPA-CTERM sorting domain-containing protein [Gammaproteobacteria bacterium]
MKSITRTLLLAMLPAVPMASMATTTQCGPDVCYQYDETQAAIALLGNPRLVGDDLQFLPWDFWAISSDGTGAGAMSTIFTFDRVYTLSGADILGLTVHEEGDYEIVGHGGVADLLDMQASSNVNALDTGGASAPFNAAGDSSGPRIWTNTLSFNPGFSGPANDMKLSITNTLTADTAGSGDYAFIHKKFVLQTLTTVPVPAAVWLLGSGLGLLGLLRRRATT